MPEAIKDDCLKDTFVSLLFYSEYSRDYLETLVLKKLEEQFGPDSFSKIPLVINGSVQEGKWFWANNQFRIMIDNETIQFNIVNLYPRWRTYSSFIKDVLSSLEGKATFKQASVRYVSFFQDRELSTMIDGTIKMNQLDSFPGAQYRFRCSARNDAKEIVASAEVQLSDRYKMQDGSFCSIIDIKVWRDLYGNTGEFDSALDLVHRHQKHLFFLLLSEPFFNELKV